MKIVEKGRKFSSEEEYFLYEEKSELRHELMNKNLYQMSGASIQHNEICGNIYVLLRSLLKKSDWKIFIESFKVRTPDGNFFYPDVCVCSPSPQKYYSDEPVLIVEVLSKSTRNFDLSDKFIEYRKIKTLDYYLCVEPEQQVVFFYYKTESGEWIAETFTKDNSVLNFPRLSISFTVKEVYLL